MTAQFTDPVKYRGKSYSLAGINGSKLFDPADHAMKPVGRCSACWRGFVCVYAVRDGSLLLDSLEVCLDDPAPILYNVKPITPDGEYVLFDTVYRRLSHPIPCTGGLLIADDFIKELYVHMGFHPAWKYRNVHELILENGRLVEEHDRSTAIAEFRDEMSHRSLEPHLEKNDEGIHDWIEKCFSRNYRW